MFFYGWDEIERVCIFRAVNQHCLFVQSLHQVNTLYNEHTVVCNEFKFTIPRRHVEESVIA